MKQRELIDYCNRHIQGGGGCPCKFDWECDQFYEKYNTDPFLEDKLHDGKHYTDKEVEHGKVN